MPASYYAFCNRDRSCKYYLLLVAAGLLVQGPFDLIGAFLKISHNHDGGPPQSSYDLYMTLYTLAASHAEHLIWLKHSTIHIIFLLQNIGRFAQGQGRGVSKCGGSLRHRAWVAFACVGEGRARSGIETLNP